jgi:hypothetical protein
MQRMRTWFECTAASIGAQAWETSCLEPVAETIGVTSRGLFLITPPQRIVFVSDEPRRSPLTITLDRTCARDRFRAMAQGDAAQFSANRLIFPSIAVAVLLSPDVVWHTPPPAGSINSPEMMRSTLRSIGTLIAARRRVDGFGALLFSLLDGVTPPPEQAASLDRLLAIQRAVRADDNRAALAGLTNLLGQGRGLTPSGDDVAIGLLLMLNRWHTDRDWTNVNRAVIEAAHRATTTISANLIECATAGQGDERLIAVVDGIAAGSAPIEECVESVLGWGSSSGIDALVGMAIAL